MVIYENLDVLGIYFCDYWLHVEIHRNEIFLFVLFNFLKSVFFVKTGGLRFRVYKNIPASNTLFKKPFNSAFLQLKEDKSDFSFKVIIRRSES